MAVGDTHNLLRDTEDRIPHMTFGSGPPTAAPEKKGDEYLDETNKRVYKAFGTTDAGDWQVLN